MKSLFSSLLFVCLLNPVFAGVFSTEQLRNSLITNTWHETNVNEWTGFGLMMEFYDNGTATVINNTHAEWPSMARFNWSVDLLSDVAVVTFRDNNGMLFRYTSIPTAQGMDLLPFQSEIRAVVHLKYGNRVTAAQWNKNHQTLMGCMGIYGTSNSIR